MTENQCAESRSAFCAARCCHSRVERIHWPTRAAMMEGGKFISAPRRPRSMSIPHGFVPMSLRRSECASRFQRAVESAMRAGQWHRARQRISRRRRAIAGARSLHVTHVLGRYVMAIAIHRCHFPVAFAPLIRFGFPEATGRLRDARRSGKTACRTPFMSRRTRIT